jgi:hypothetical protein
MDDYSGWLSLRELDEASGRVKGTAFRAFKARLDALTEGRDFLVLDHQTHAEPASALHAQGRLYRSSVNPVLLAPALAAQILDQLREAEGRP